MTAGEIIGEAIDIHHLAQNRAQRTQRIRELLELVGLRGEDAGRYPHAFSGGQQQRVGIARALAVEPEFLVCDEPISALDVSIQAQVVNLLEDMQRELKLTYLFIAHDLSVVRHISQRIGVMYLGSLVELAGSGELIRRPLHPYTQVLLSAVPTPDPRAGPGAHRAPGGDPLPAGAAAGMPLPPALPPGGPGLREALPAHAGDHSRALRGLPPGGRIGMRSSNMQKKMNIREIRIRADGMDFQGSLGTIFRSRGN